MAKTELEGLTQAPIVILAGDIVYCGAELGQVFLGRQSRGTNILRPYTSFPFAYIEAVYDWESKPKWQNPNLANHRKAEMHKGLRGTQLVFSDSIAYEVTDCLGSHFSILREGEYVGHDHAEGTAFDLNDVNITAILNRNGRLIRDNKHKKKRY